MDIEMRRGDMERYERWDGEEDMDGNGKRDKVIETNGYGMRTGGRYMG